VRAEPEGLAAAAVVHALRLQWGFDADAVEYAPVGGGSYHWVVSDATGRRAFVTVDDLDHKAWLGETRDAAFAGLRRAFDTAVALRESGLQFVVAPLGTGDGASLVRLDSRYSVALFPFLDGAAGQFGRYGNDEDRRGVAALLAELHRATAAASTVGFELPGRRHLEAALADRRTPWTCGPLSEPSRAAINESAGHLAELIALADRFSADARARSGGWVVSHGEPHAANVLRTAGGQRLLDWDTVALGPPERDLWLVVSDESAAQEVYERASGRRLDETALDFFRLTWDLKDLAEYLNVLRAPHCENEDTLRHYRALTQVAAVREKWRSVLD
jgi:spectinomycin phosphotransferase